jgi:hypothetical protein
MSVTLVEAAKLNSGDVLRSAIIEFYAGSSDILMTLPFETIQGNALKYNQEETMPGIGFRGVNGSYTESTGVLNPQTENLTISGGDLDVDKFIIDTMGPSQRSVQESMKARALALAWTKTFIKGDSSVNPKEFDGLQTRLVNDQLIPAGATSGGDALSLTILDQLIDQVQMPTHLIMNKGMRRRLTQAARNQSVGGFVNYVQDSFGRTQMTYNDLPILIVDLDNEGNAILPFTEANPGGGTAASTSIYCVSFTDEGVQGLQNGTIEGRDLGELDSKPAFRTRVEWYSSFGVFHSRGAARLNGIKDAAIVA